MITGLSFAANHALASLLQESLQSAALLLTGAAGRGAVDERRWSRAALAVDAAAIAAGLGVQRALARADNERLPRAGARSGGFLLAATGVGGLLIGGLQEVLDRRSTGRRASQFVVVPAAAVSPSAASCSGGGGRVPTTGERRRRRTLGRASRWR